MAEVIGSSATTTPRPFLEWRLLLKAPGLASDSRKLILAGVGLLALYAGWNGIDLIFPGSQLPYEPLVELPGSGMAEKFPRPSVSGLLDAASDLTEPIQALVAPLADLFVKGLGAQAWFQSALMGLWAAIVWGITGGAIARIAVVQAADDRQIGLRSAVRFAIRKSVSLIGAPLTPMLAVAVLVAGCALFGLIERIPAGIGGILTTILGFVPLFLGFLMALILVGLALGWPLMHVTIAAEGEDAPDALSRAYSYVNQRLARYLAHLIASLLIGAVALMLVITFARLVLGLADWGVSLTAPDPEQLSDGAQKGRIFWEHVVGWLVLAWVYSYFWSAESIIYLILRRDVDGTPWHDVHLPEHAAETFAGDVLPDPPLKDSAPAASAAP